MPQVHANGNNALLKDITAKLQSSESPPKSVKKNKKSPRLSLCSQLDLFGRISNYSAVSQKANFRSGELDEHKHRNSVNGWKVAGLPWTQT